MNGIIVRFGLIIGAVLIGFNIISEAILAPTVENFEASEVIGYSGIVLSMTLIFFAVKRYRDQLVTGALSFAKAFGVGLMTDLVTSVVYGLFMLYYFASLSPEFLATYIDYYKGQIRMSGLPAGEIAAQIAEIDANVGLYTNPYVQSLVMGATVFLIGAAISLISALILMRRGEDLVAD